MIKIDFFTFKYHFRCFCGLKPCSNQKYDIFVELLPDGGQKCQFAVEIADTQGTRQLQGNSTARVHCPTENAKDSQFKSVRTLARRLCCESKDSLKVVCHSVLYGPNLKVFSVK